MLELRQFLGIVINLYRQFLPNAARVQALLNSLQSSNKKRDKTPIIWIWTDEARNSFKECNHLLPNSAILAHPSKDKKLSMMVDACDTAIGAVVVQQLTEDGWQPLSFLSRNLKLAEQKYSAYDRELLAAYSAVKHFRHYIEGRLFTLFTDHKPLTFAFAQKPENSSPRQLRHLDLLGQYTTDIQHVAGKNNLVADALSRIVAICFDRPIDYEQLAKEQVDDPELQRILSNTTLKIKLLPIPNRYSRATTLHRWFSLFINYD